MAVPNAARKAREQARAYRSVFVPTDLELDDGSTIEIPPHPEVVPGQLDDDCQAAYEELLFEVESYDRHPDVHFPEQKTVDGMLIPAETRRGAVMTPHRKDGVLIKPPWSQRVVRACLGDTRWKQLLAGGRQAKDVWEIWNRQGQAVLDRQDADPKSDGGDKPVESGAD